MFDPVSILTIAAAIGALISGFKDGKSMFSKWLKARRDKKALAQANLHGELDRSPDIIQSNYNEGRARFGRLFCNGDDVARSSMMQTLTQMNGHLIEVLKQALNNTSHFCLNLTILCKATVTARNDTVDIFHSLRQRLHVRAPISRLNNFAFTMESFAQSPTQKDTALFSGRRERDSTEYLPPCTYAPEPKPRKPNSESLGRSYRAPQPELASGRCSPSYVPEPEARLELVDTATELRRGLNMLSSHRSTMVSSPVLQPTATVDVLRNTLSAMGGPPVDMQLPCTTVGSAATLARNLQALRLNLAPLRIDTSRSFSRTTASTPQGAGSKSVSAVTSSHPEALSTSRTAGQTLPGSCSAQTRRQADEWAREVPPADFSSIIFADSRDTAVLPELDSTDLYRSETSGEHQTTQRRTPSEHFQGWSKPTWENETSRNSDTSSSLQGIQYPLAELQASCEGISARYQNWHTQNWHTQNWHIQN